VLLSGYPDLLHVFLAHCEFIDVYCQHASRPSPIIVPHSQVSLAIAWLLLLLLELARCKRVPWLGAQVHAFMSRFVDARDANAAAYTTHLSLLMGLAAPIWLASAQDHHLAPVFGDRWWLLACAGMVSIGVGDAAAAVVGSTLGTHPLHSATKKTWEGTIAGVVSMLLCNMWLLRGAVVGSAQLMHLLTRFALPTMCTALLEAATEQLDNIVVPLWHTTWMAMAISN
jgi:dolichol kinase